MIELRLALDIIAGRLGANYPSKVCIFTLLLGAIQVLCNADGVGVGGRGGGVLDFLKKSFTKV